MLTARCQLSRRGGTGRRAQLKIAFLRECGFDPLRRQFVMCLLHILLKRNLGEMN